MDSEKYGFHTRKQTTIYYNQIVPQLEGEYHDSSWHNDVCDSIMFILSEELGHEIQVFFPNSKVDDVENEEFNTFNVKVTTHNDIINQVFITHHDLEMINYINKMASEYKATHVEPETKSELKKYILGQNYRYSEIPEEDTEEFTVSEYGLDYIGQSGIHIRYHKHETDIWFVWDSMANEGIFKCVYNK
jgi:hypothetical protein